jgi:hypothetical protein
MDTNNYILNTQLPLSQDFRSLKKEGLAYIQEYGGVEWTNLNASDAGVTILDQVCYALTELGYCNNFPVKDILTRANGKLEIKDQFYLPQDILTTSPVTIADYRKYIVDGVEGITNVLVHPVNNTDAMVCGMYYGVYKVYLAIDPSVNSNDIETICREAFFYLNKSRNLGELFLMPLALKAAPHFITGCIEIDNEAEVNDILACIQDKIRNYIFPEVVQMGYDQSRANGIDTNEIFNGPLLKKGWILTNALGKKKNKLGKIELTQLINSVPGVTGITDLFFDKQVPPCNQVTSKKHELLVIDINRSVAEGLQIYCKGRRLSADTGLISVLGKAGEVDISILHGASVNTEVKPPKGKYRNINSYYSIQNTFPEVFAVGADAVNSNASDFQIAQSRQLKGYLTLFDQVLANQFSQLANIDALFSFKNSSCGSPSEEALYYAVKNQLDIPRQEYPAPYMAFSPTYFYQALYDVPHIRPLLKDNDTFKFSLKIEPDKKLEEKSWTAYKHDPYNPYIRGVMEMVEEERAGLQRRNDILDHLLARHGESPVVINAIIDGSVYSGDSLKDQVIFKSLYLQNLGLLSYFRQKAYTYMGANKLSSQIRPVPVNFEEKILGGNAKDFIFNSEGIDRIEKLTAHDFVNYSAIELQLSLLFGLKVQYRDFIANNYHDPLKAEEIKLAMWMIKQRKGLIFLEIALISRYTLFVISIIWKASTGIEFCWQISKKLDYEELLGIINFLNHIKQEDLADAITAQRLTIGTVNYALQQKEGYMQPGANEQRIADTNYFFAFDMITRNGIAGVQVGPVLNSSLKLVFPKFIPQLNTPEFKERLNFFLQTTLPVSVPYQCYFVDAHELEKLIPVFVGWHNSLIYNNKKRLFNNQQRVCSQDLALLLTKINDQKDE